jgi:hypothetical protein
MKRLRTCKTKDCENPATDGVYCYECAVKTPAPLWRG